MKYRRIDLGKGNHWGGRQHLEIVQHAPNPPHRWPAVEGRVPRVAGCLTADYESRPAPYEALYPDRLEWCNLKRQFLFIG